MAQPKWSYSKGNTLRQCRRKFFFAYILKSWGRKNLFRRKAYELARMKNLKMWQGHVVDKVMTDLIIPEIQAKEPIDYTAAAEYAVELAKKQFNYSEKQVYKQPKAKEETDEEQEACILDIHELEKEIDEETIAESYVKIRQAILNISTIKMPDEQTLLIDFLSNSYPLLPNIQSWSFEIEGMKVNPQLDLVGYYNYKPYVIDWKVSESFASDYYKQLLIGGLTVYYKRLEKIDKPPFAYKDIRLFKVNLLQGDVCEYSMNEDDVNILIDEINLTGGDIEMIEKEEAWDKVDIAALQFAENEGSCEFCNYKSLCRFLYLNDHKYDENSYLQSVRTIEFERA